MNDRRLTPANGRVAHVSLKRRVKAERFVAGEPARVAVALADLLARPGGPRDRQVLMGERVNVLDRDGGFAFVQAEKDGYCGYLAEGALAGDRAATHWVAAPATHLYREPSLKTPEVAYLTMGARLTIVAEHPRFLETADGFFAPRPHLRELGDWAADPAAVAESLLGTPYLWGGNSRSGIDCSGLVQAALLACGRPCPGDSDLQEAGVGTALAEGTPFVEATFCSGRAMWRWRSRPNGSSTRTGSRWPWATKTCRRPLRGSRGRAKARSRRGAGCDLRNGLLRGRHSTGRISLRSRTRSTAARSCPRLSTCPSIPISAYMPCRFLSRGCFSIR